MSKLIYKLDRIGLSLKYCFGCTQMLIDGDTYYSEPSKKYPLCQICYENYSMDDSVIPDIYLANRVICRKCYGSGWDPQIGVSESNKLQTWCQKCKSKGSYVELGTPVTRVKRIDIKKVFFKIEKDMHVKYPCFSCIKPIVSYFFKSSDKQYRLCRDCFIMYNMDDAFIPYKYKYDTITCQKCNGTSKLIKPKYKGIKCPFCENGKRRGAQSILVTGNDSQKKIQDDIEKGLCIVDGIFVTTKEELEQKRLKKRKERKNKSRYEKRCIQCNERCW